MEKRTFKDAASAQEKEYDEKFMVAMVDGFGSVGPRNLRGRRARDRQEAVLEALQAGQTGAVFKRQVVAGAFDYEEQLYFGTQC